MARPKRSSKSGSPSPSPAFLPGVALSLVAAIAAGFFASRAFRKRSQVGARSPLSSLTPALPQSLLSPSPSSRFSDDEPVLQSVSCDVQVDKNEQQFPESEFRAVIEVKTENATDTRCSPRLNGMDNSTATCNLEVNSAGQLLDFSASATPESVVHVQTPRNDVVLESREESIPIVESFSGGEKAREHAAGEGAIPVAEFFSGGEKAEEQDVESVIPVQISVELNNDGLPPPQRCSDDLREKQNPSEQSSVLVNGKTVESYRETESNEDHHESLNGSTLSDCTGCTVDSEGSSQEVTSAAVRPLDSCVEEGEDTEVGTRCAKVRPFEIELSSNDSLADGKENFEQLIDLSNVDRAGTKKLVEELSTKVDCNQSSVESGGVAHSSPKYLLPEYDEQASPTGHQSEVHESVGSVMPGYEVSAPSLHSEVDSSGSDQHKHATGVFNEFWKAPKNSLGNSSDESEEKRAAESPRDSNPEISNLKAEVRAVSEFSARKVSTKRDICESFDPEDSLKKTQILEQPPINDANDIPGLEKTSFYEVTLLAEEELDRCSTSEDTDVRLESGRLDRKEERMTEVNSRDMSVESCDERFRCDCVVQQDVSGIEELQLDPQHVVLPKKTASELMENKRTDLVFEFKKFGDVNLSEAISEDQAHAYSTGRNFMFSAKVRPTVQLQRERLTNFARNVPIETALISALIGLLSLALWFLRSLTICETSGVIAQS